MFDFIKAVHDRMPHMNKELLVDFHEEQLSKAADFIETCFSWGTQHLTDGSLRYIGKQIVSPMDRVIFDLFGQNTQGQKAIIKKGAAIPSNTSELTLVKYNFIFNNTLHSVYIYVPYLKNYMLNINSKQHVLLHNIVEKVFSRVGSRNYDGVIIRPIRARLHFYRHTQYALIDECGQYISLETIIRTVLHHKTHSRRKRETTIIGYLLAKFGLEQTLSRFGYTLDDITFVDILPDLKIDDGFHYFKAFREKKGYHKVVYLKTKASLDSDLIARRLIANILYVVTYFPAVSADELLDPEGQIFRAFLGMIIKPSSNYISAKADMDSHLLSVDYFIDPLTRERFHSFGIDVDDIYGLLVYIFTDIDNIVANCHTQNLYQKRFDITDGVLIEAYAKIIFSNFYNSNQKDVLQYGTVKRILKIDPMAIKIITSSKNQKSGIINLSPQIFNDNAVLICASKVRHIVSSSQDFHPSLMVVESLHSFTGEEVGRGGHVNVYCPFDKETGAIRCPDYSENINRVFSTK